MMLGIGDYLPEFEVTGVKPGFMMPEENGVSAFEKLTHESFGGKWKVFYFYPKDFTFVCPTEILEFAALNSAFEERNCVVMGGSTDNEFCKLAWRREHPLMNNLNQWMFADTNGLLVDGFGIRSEAGVCYRATYIVDEKNVIQHVSVNNLDVGRNPEETLRILDACQSGELSFCKRPIGGFTQDNKKAA